MQAVLEGRALAKTYRSGDIDVLALRGVDIRVAPGECVAVVGRSGCGKSTLLHLLGGLDRATAGEVYVEGRRVDGVSDAEWARLRRRRIGFIFQAFHLLDAMSALDNVALPARLAGHDRAGARKRAGDLLCELGLENRVEATPAQLSGGEQQRVAIARALVNRPAVVLADEPTGNLDTDSARTVLELLTTQRGEDRGLLIVTHDPRVAAGADRVVRLRDGLVVGDTALAAAGTRPAQLVELEGW
ncbi:MAG TPA: ABC transporter ATP-binding protein [Solirubrobacteraceae bacterium]|nr:ABC transporter ATP-binding protein [Solirubrobacteraceae bacterium]